MGSAINCKLEDRILKPNSVNLPELLNYLIAKKNNCDYNSVSRYKNRKR